MPVPHRKNPFVFGPWWAANLQVLRLWQERRCLQLPHGIAGAELHRGPQAAGPATGQGDAAQGRRSWCRCRGAHPRRPASDPRIRAAILGRAAQVQARIRSHAVSQAARPWPRRDRGIRTGLRSVRRRAHELSEGQGSQAITRAGVWLGGPFRPGQFRLRALSRSAHVPNPL